MYFSRVRIRPEIFKGSQLAKIIGGNPNGMHRLLWDLFTDQESRNFIYREEIAREQLGKKAGVRGEPLYYIVSSTKPYQNTPLFKVETKEYKPRLRKGDQLSFKLRANPVVTRRKEGEKRSKRHDIVMDAQRSLLLTMAGDIGANTTAPKLVLKQKVLSMLTGPQQDAIATKLRDVIDSNERYMDTITRNGNPEKLLSMAMKANSDSALEKWFVDKQQKIGFQFLRDKKNRLKFQAEGYKWNALPGKGKKAGFSSIDFDGEIEIVDPDNFLKILFNGIGPAKAFGCGLMLVKRI